MRTKIYIVWGWDEMKIRFKGDEIRVWARLNLLNI